MATEEVRTMWVIFLGSGMVFGAAALALIWIGSRVLLSICPSKWRAFLFLELFHPEAMWLHNAYH